MNNNITRRVEIQPRTWLPEAYRFGTILESDDIRYALFGAGALAVHNVMVRPTIDIDIVVDDYKKAVNILKEQPDLKSCNLEKEKDGIQVDDFYFESGVTIQIWDNNLYSLPMTDDSWSSVVLRQVPGYGTIKTICMEDLIISKVGRYTQQKSDSKYEAEKNVGDIIATIQTLSRPDFKYAIKRLKEGARRQTSSNSSKIHRLDWYFVREVPIYQKVAKGFDHDKTRRFISTILAKSKSSQIEYELLHSLRKGSRIDKFQSDFMLDDNSLSTLLDRWKSVIHRNDNKVQVSSKDIQNYIKTLEPGTLSEYAKRIVFSGNRPSNS